MLVFCGLLGCDTKEDAGVGEDCASSVFYADSDGDGSGDVASTTEACELPSGYAEDATDCDDSDAAVNPTAEESCDGLDNSLSVWASANLAAEVQVSLRITGTVTTAAGGVNTETDYRSPDPLVYTPWLIWVVPSGRRTSAGEVSGRKTQTARLHRAGGLLHQRLQATGEAGRIGDPTLSDLGVIEQEPSERLEARAAVRVEAGEGTDHGVLGVDLQDPLVLHDLLVGGLEDVLHVCTHCTLLVDQHAGGVGQAA